MVRPIDDFGGWLRFFQIDNWLVILALIFDIVDLSMGLKDLGTVKAVIRDSLTIIEFTAYIYMTYKMLNVIQLKSADIPNIISKLLLTLLILSASFLVIKMFVTSEMPMTSVKIMGGEVFYFIAWANYFERSKRVKAYYGANCNLPFL
ncbi:MAG: hypothetical protein IEMM0008_0305 [bacterium]|nr:MAG: hypothetical protein IEMM0008_0305 [bacterium]